jgi:hypothetical protein
MRGFVKTVSAVFAGIAALVSLDTAANAQEIQLTGPLAGAPAVRKLRLHRDGRFEFSPGVSFSLLDQYLRTIMPGATLTYHATDWLGFGVWGGYGFQYSTGLAQNLQSVAIDGRDCTNRESVKACRLTAVNLTRGSLADNQLGHIKWIVAPQAVAVPFRGKLSLFSALFVDADVSVFAGPAIIGLSERRDCGTATGDPACDAKLAFVQASRVTVAPTFGLGLNFYPGSWFGIGFEFRALPFSWNTSGFDNHGGGSNGDSPDFKVNSSDREFHFNTLGTINLKFALPPSIKATE